MTNREAIAQLKEINREAHIYSEAVDMAISALQAQDAPDINVGDMISRQDAIAEFSCCELTPDGGIDANYAIDFLKQLPSAEPEQSIAQERYGDLCEYFKDCSDQGRSILNDRKEFKSWLDRMKWHVMECDKLGRELEKLKSAQPETHKKRMETHACDLIDRQAAIDALKEKRDSAKEWYEESSASGDEMMSARAESAIMTFVECLLTIKKLPSAHPDGIPLEWIDKHLEWLDNCDNDFAQLAKVGIRAMVEIWKKDKT